jgi:ribonuclease P protein component
MTPKTALDLSSEPVHRLSDEANLPAKETQARPHAWVSRTDADACWQDHDQAPSQEGALAAHRLASRPVDRARDGIRRRRPRLSKNADFQRVYRQGRSVSSRHLVLYGFPREDVADGDRPGDEESRDARTVRLGVSVGRRVGGAVERNRVKRLLREGFWSLAEDLPRTHDYVIVARPSAAELARSRGLAGFTEDIGRLLGELAESVRGGRAA